MKHTMDEIAKTKRDRLEKLAIGAGFNSINHLATSCGISTSNIYTNFRGQWEMSIKRMFKLANACKVPIEVVIDIFYPELMQENMDIVAEEVQTTNDID